MILLIDNFDSFTYNLYQYLLECGAEVEVRRVNQITIPEIVGGRYRGVVISPGPNSPSESGISLACIPEVSGILPLLGVCLGHQCMVQSFGGRVVRGSRPVHGKASRITHDGTGIFAGIPNPVEVGRYHSLVGEVSSFPDCLRVTARSEDDEVIMGLAHREHPTWGVQFHPESILTQHGHAMMRNFVSLVNTFHVKRDDGASV
jgi:anthranilate synthase/aminodeoxychorismate synthase-like glutamine amidotransferase